MPKFVERDNSQLYLLPPDIRDWVPADDLVHFVLEAGEGVPTKSFLVNMRGTATTAATATCRCTSSLAGTG